MTAKKLFTLAVAAINVLCVMSQPRLRADNALSSQCVETKGKTGSAAPIAAGYEPKKRADATEKQLCRLYSLCLG